jgi:AraC-like DNA-binding protein
MKTELEQIDAHANSSLRLMVNPNLSDFFFWHFHPEFELVFIDGANGTRHIGKHISRYEGSDLVFIGSNIPHLNFDYGIKTPYEKIVVHIRPEFLKEAFSSTPELHAIHLLFEQSKQGVAFGKHTKMLVGDRLKNLHKLGYFEQFLEVLSILQLLSQSTEKEFLHNHPVENPHTQKEQGRLKTIYQFLDDQYQRKIELSEVAALCNLTNAAFCRYFKRMTKLTFTEFINHYRIDKAKNLLRQDFNITETCFQCGFESISYFNKIFKKVTGVNPLAFKKRHQSPFDGNM